MLTPEQIFASPTASGWLKGALLTAMNRDAVDAANDAEILAKILNSRAAALCPDKHLQSAEYNTLCEISKALASIANAQVPLTEQPDRLCELADRLTDIAAGAMIRRFQLERAPLQPRQERRR